MEKKEFSGLHDNQFQALIMIHREFDNLLENNADLFTTSFYHIHEDEWQIDI